MTELWVCHAGLLDYREALALQQRLCAARQDGLIPDTMLLLEHPAVVTRGRRAAPEDLPFGEAWLAERGVDVVDVNRGGKLTYHGPGQLVGYPIVAVDDVVAYVRLLERALISALAEQGVSAHARVEDGPDYTGVWVEDRKIASIGVHVSRGVATHGFAVNVDNDMAPWTWFTACGLPSVQMTSVAAELTGPDPDCMDCFAKRAGHAVAKELGARQRLVTPARLESALNAVPA
ncbi:MAG: lipoyl(octanoyl) transferase LipB [Solirubrobacterales bacterium]|nr:lipoyl(octanoyl) transferase LipB [Solirubrobacterales bacterium]